MCYSGAQNQTAQVLPGKTRHSEGHPRLFCNIFILCRGRSMNIPTRWSTALMRLFSSCAFARLCTKVFPLFLHFFLTLCLWPFDSIGESSIRLLLRLVHLRGRDQRVCLRNPGTVLSKGTSSSKSGRTWKSNCQKTQEKQILRAISSKQKLHFSCNFILRTWADWPKISRKHFYARLYFQFHCFIHERGRGVPS